MDYLKNALDKYAIFSGRTSRKEFWMFNLWFTIFYVAIWLVSFLLDKLVIGNILGFERPATTILPLTFTLYFLIPSISMTARRLHDANKSAGWLLLYFVPIIGQIWLIVLLVLKGTIGNNLYGESPSGVTAEAPTATAITGTKAEEEITEKTPTE